MSVKGQNQPLFQDVQLSFAQHIRHPDLYPLPDDIEPRRMKIYVDLFYNNIENFVASAFPVTRSLFSDQDWHAMVRDFVHRHHSESPYFIDISQEFLEYVAQERKGVDDPPFLLELCHYEWVELSLDVAEADVDWNDKSQAVDLLAERPVVSPLVMSLSYRYPVHQISQDNQPLEPPEQQTWLLVYRNRHDEVAFMASNPVTARLLELLQAGELTGRAALEQVGSELGSENMPNVLQSGLQTLETLLDADIITGTVTEG